MTALILIYWGCSKRCLVAAAGRSKGRWFLVLALQQALHDVNTDAALDSSRPLTSGLNQVGDVGLAGLDGEEGNTSYRREGSGDEEAVGAQLGHKGGGVDPFRVAASRVEVFGRGRRALIGTAVPTSAHATKMGGYAPGFGLCVEVEANDGLEAVAH